MTSSSLGRRLPDGAKWHGDDPDSAMPGDYGRVLVDGEWQWRCRTPNGLRGLLTQHTVTEHDDGTITVEPSILCDWPHPETPRRYHGYLRRGVWETLDDTNPMPDAVYG
jgi:hypothetical protein